MIAVDVINYLHNGTKTFVSAAEFQFVFDTMQYGHISMSDSNDQWLYSLQTFLSRFPPMNSEASQIFETTVLPIVFYSRV
jgi:hypothetical protein